jgi:hypothetical protein
VVQWSSSGGTLQWFTAHYQEVLFCGSVVVIRRYCSMVYCSLSRGTILWFTGRHQEVLFYGLLLIIKRYYSVVHWSSSGGTILWFTARHLEVLFCIYSSWYMSCRLAASRIGMELILLAASQHKHMTHTNCSIYRIVEYM